MALTDTSRRQASEGPGIDRALPVSGSRDGGAGLDHADRRALPPELEADGPPPSGLMGDTGLPPELEADRQRLLRRFRRQAHVSDPVRGYIQAPWVNLDIDAAHQRHAARLIAHRFAGQGVSRVVGIPTLGVPLATTVAEELARPLVPGRKDDAVPGAWARVVEIEEVASFTTGRVARFTFNATFLQPGEHLLLVDDFCAHGSTGRTIARGFLQAGYHVSFAAYCAKLFQGGLASIAELGIETFYAVGIAAIRDGQLILEA